MKKLLIRLLIFVLIVSSVISALVVLSGYLINDRKEILLSIDKDVRFVFAGNSTVECAVDNRQIEHSLNIAQAGEAYMYTYAKLRALLNENEQINQVFLSFSYADILMEKEESWLFSDYFIIEKVQYYNYLLGKPEKKLLIHHNPRAYLKGVLRSVVKSCESVIFSFRKTDNTVSVHNFGGYKHLIRDKLNADPGLETGDPLVTEQSVFQIKYLGMISELCRESAVRLILLNPPKHFSYNESVSKEIKQNWIDVRNSLATDSLLDLSGFLMPDSCYADLSHLNYRGARIFSEYLNGLLNPDPMPSN